MKHRFSSILGAVIGISICAVGWFCIRYYKDYEKQLQSEYASGLDPSTTDVSLKIADNVFIRQTSALSYILCDGDGFSLAPGTIIKFYFDANAHAIYVAYVTFPPQVQKLSDIAASDMSYAIVQLNRSGKIDGSSLKKIPIQSAAHKSEFQRLDYVDKVVNAQK
jgi:hypothetical protein